MFPLYVLSNYSKAQGIAIQPFKHEKSNAVRATFYLNCQEGSFLVH